MKILLDHNLDRRLKDIFEGVEVSTAFECGWEQLSNGELLTSAEATGFDVVLTADTNISKQQSLEGRKISIVVLRALDNRRATHVEMIGDIMEVLNRIEPGTLIEVFHPFLKKDGS